MNRWLTLSEATAALTAFAAFGLATAAAEVVSRTPAKVAPQREERSSDAFLLRRSDAQVATQVVK
jgi:hypothetical protein